MIRVGVIGYGYWGPVVARNIHSSDGCSLVAICDGNSAALARASKTYPDVQMMADPMDLIRSPQVDAVAVVTPVWTHFEFAKAALENGKHIFVEKPFTATASQALELIDLALARNLQIMVDHTFLFTGAVRKMRQLIDEGKEEDSAADHGGCQTQSNGEDVLAPARCLRLFGHPVVLRFPSIARGCLVFNDLIVAFQGSHAC